MKPTQEQAIAWALQAGIYHEYDSEGHWDGLTDQVLAGQDHLVSKDYKLKRIAEILLPVLCLAYEAGQKDALSNIDPSKLMSYQEGYEAGRKDENEACAEVIENAAQMYVEPTWAFTCVKAIRARREQ